MTPATLCGLPLLPQPAASLIFLNHIPAKIDRLTWCHFSSSCKVTPDNSTLRPTQMLHNHYPTQRQNPSSPIICSLPQGTRLGIRSAWAQQVPESSALLSPPPLCLYNSTKGKQLSQQPQWPGREETAAKITSVSNGELQSFSVPQKHQLIIRHSQPPQSACISF